MADASAFDFVCGHLEQRTTLNRLEARGTVRLALKAAGLDAAHVTPAQMRTVVEKILPGELRNRAVEGPERHCTAIAALLASTQLAESGGNESPEAIFARLATS
jgi:predicted YcjX-like family ATPase